jgi:hypothetical protein
MDIRWIAKIRLKNGASQRINLTADNYENAKTMIEQIYGQNSIISGPYCDQMTRIMSRLRFVTKFRSKTD